MIDVHAHQQEAILFSGDPIESGGTGSGRQGLGPDSDGPRLRGLPMVFLAAGAQVLVGDAAFTDGESFDDLATRDEVRAAERRAAQRNEPMPDAFLFFNRNRTELKLLLWTDFGFTVLHHRLDGGAYAFARNVLPGEQISVRELADLLGAARRRASFAASSLETAPPRSWH